MIFWSFFIIKILRICQAFGLYIEIIFILKRFFNVLWQYDSFQGFIHDLFLNGFIVSSLVNDVDELRILLNVFLGDFRSKKGEKGGL